MDPESIVVPSDYIGISVRLPGRFRSAGQDGEWGRQKHNAEGEEGGQSPRGIATPEEHVVGDSGTTSSAELLLVVTPL